MVRLLFVSVVLVGALRATTGFADPSGICMTPDEFRQMKQDRPDATFMGVYNSPEIQPPRSGTTVVAVINIPQPQAGMEIIGVLCGSTQEGEHNPAETPGHWCDGPGNQCHNYSPSYFLGWRLGVGGSAQITFANGVQTYQYGFAFVYVAPKK